MAAPDYDHERDAPPRMDRSGGALRQGLRTLSFVLHQTVWQPLLHGAARRAVPCVALAAGVVWLSRPGSALGAVLCFALFAGLSFVALALARVPALASGSKPPKPLSLLVGGLLLLGLLAPALILRLALIPAGLPYGHFWDEPQVLGTALRMFKTHDLNPHFFAYPSVSINLQYLWLHASFALVRAVGQVAERSDLLTGDEAGFPWHVSHPLLWYLGRLLHALLSLASIVLVYRIARQLADGKRRTGALLAACLMVHNRMLVEHSSCGTVDSVTAFFSTLWAFFLVRFGAAPSLRGVLALSMSAGLLASCKYNAGVVLFPTLWAIVTWAPALSLSLSASASISAPASADVSQARASRAAWAVATLGLFALGFFLGSPAMLLSPWSFLSDMIYEFRHYAYLGHEGAQIDSRPAKLLHDYRFFLTAFPVPHTVAALWLWVLVRWRQHRRPRVETFLFAFPLLYLAFMGVMKVTFVRNFVLVMPFLCLFCGQVVDQAAGWLQDRTTLRRVFETGVLCVCLAILWPRWQQAWTALPGLRLRGDDTRRTVLAALAPRVAGAHVAILAELHVHPEDLAQLQPRPDAASPSTAAAAGVHIVPLSQLSEAGLRQQGVRYLLTGVVDGLATAAARAENQRLQTDCRGQALSDGFVLRPETPVLSPKLIWVDLQNCR